MNIATSRFTLSTILVAACAMAALIAAEPVQAQTAAPVQRIEIVGQRIVPVQRIEIVGQRQAEPAIQRIVITGQRLKTQRVADAVPKARGLLTAIRVVLPGPTTAQAIQPAD